MPSHANGDLQVWRSIREVVSSPAAGHMKLAALLVLQTPHLSQREFARRMRGLHAHDCILGPQAVAFVLRMLATRTPPGKARNHLLAQMQKALEESRQMAKIKNGWSQLGSDPWEIVHGKPPKQVARYVSS